jgi:hypothetical protein
MRTTTSFSGETELPHRPSVSQIIGIKDLMEIPDYVFSAITDAVSRDPELVESFLQEKKRGEDWADIYRADKVKGIYECLGEQEVSTSPDVTCFGKKSEMPGLVFSDYIKQPICLIMAQIDGSVYPETLRFLGQLEYFDEWKKTALKNSYFLIGKYQREFFEHLERARHVVFNQEDLANKLGVSVGTVSRLMSDRWVRAVSIDEKEKTIPSKDLLVTKDALGKYLVLPLIDETLKEEFEAGRAYSDSEIERAIGRVVARRTVAKYRKGLGVPNASERDRAYRSGSRTEPYSVIV